MSLPATLLATAGVVFNQFVKVGDNAYGTQGHFELSPQMLEEWLRLDPDLLNLGQKGIEQVRKDFQELQRQYAEIAIKMFTNFFDLFR